MRISLTESMELVQRLEMAKTIDTSVERYAPFLAITGDTNPIHTDENYALKTPFRGLVVPGLFLALRGEGHYPTNMSGLDLTFKNPTRPGQNIKLLSPENVCAPDARIRWYMVDDGSPELVLEGRIMLDNGDKNPEIMNEKEEGVKVYRGKARREDIQNIFQIAKMIGDADCALNIHAAGYISPALLGFAEKDVTGAYAKQGFRFHSKLSAEEEFTVLARLKGKKEARGQSFAMFCYNLLGQDKRPIITGTALVAEMRYHEV